MAGSEFLPLPYRRLVGSWFCRIFGLGWGVMRTNNLLTSTALTTSAMLVSGTAFAQPVAFNWTGFYVGMNAGSASS